MSAILSKKILCFVLAASVLAQSFFINVEQVDAGITSPVLNPHNESWFIDSSLNFLRVDGSGAVISESGLTSTNLGMTAVDGVGNVWSFTVTTSPYASFNSELIMVTPDYIGPDLSTSSSIVIANPSYPGYGYNITAIAIGPNNDVWMAGYRTNDDYNFIYEIIRKPFNSSSLQFFELPCLDPDVDCSGNIPTYANPDSNKIDILVVTNEGDVFGNDFMNSRIYRLDFSSRNYNVTPTITTYTSADGLDNPIGLFVDTSDHLWVTNLDMLYSPFGFTSPKIIKFALNSTSYESSVTYNLPSNIAPIDILITPDLTMALAVYDNNQGKNFVYYRDSSNYTVDLYQVEIEASAPFKHTIGLDNNGDVVVPSSQTGNLYVITDPSVPSINTHSLSLATAIEKNAGDFNGYQNSIINGPTNQAVPVYLTVNPTITFNASSNTCSFGIMGIEEVKTCTYTLTTATNATNGLTLNFSGDSAGLVSGANTVDACSGTNCNGDGISGVTAGSEEYGFYVSNVGASHLATGYTVDSQPMPTTPTTIIYATGPHTNTTSTVTHKVAVSSFTVAGSYSQSVTITAAGSF